MVIKTMTGKCAIYIEVEKDLLDAFDMTVRAVHGTKQTRTDEIKRRMRLFIAENKKVGSQYPEVIGYLKNLKSS